MIVIEGPDGSGKTTLIDQLGHIGRRVGALRPGVGGPGEALEGETTFMFYRRKLAGAAAHERNTGEKIAFDRFHLSEHIYGPILRGVQHLNPRTMFEMKELLAEQKVHVIICLPPFDVTLTNVQQEGRERPGYQTDEFLKRAYDAWYTLGCAMHSTLMELVVEGGNPWGEALVYNYAKDGLYEDGTFIRTQLQAKRA